MYFQKQYYGFHLHYFKLEQIIGVCGTSTNGWIWVMSQIAFCWNDLLLYFGAR